LRVGCDNISDLEYSPKNPVRRVRGISQEICATEAELPTHDWKGLVPSELVEVSTHLSMSRAIGLPGRARE